jgi:hypothetical protein
MRIVSEFFQRISPQRTGEWREFDVFRGEMIAHSASGPPDFSEQFHRAGGGFI